MPAYDYRCLDCRKRFDIFMTYSEYGSRPVSCPHCGSSNVQRRINKVRVARSDSSHLAQMADPANLDALDQDPRTLGRMMREMSGEIGQDMGAEFNEVVSRLEKGESPEVIERAMPDLGSGGMDGGLD
ncbi:MAG: FmdB family zinc ribbon protein [Bellilinea sp.]